MAHIPGGGLIADTLASPGEPLQELYKTGCVACLSLGVDGLDFLSGVHFQNHAGGYGLPGVGLDRPVVGIHPANAAGGVVPFYGNPKTSLNPLLDGNGGDIFVHVPDTGHGLAHIAHFPQLGRAAFAEIENHIVRLEKNRL